jgi:hypothetical protein
MMEIPKLEKKGKKEGRREEILDLEELKRQLKSYFENWMRTFRFS